MSTVHSGYNTEQKFVQYLLSGTKEAFDKLYNRYAPLLLGYLEKTIGDKQEAESLLPTIFIDIWNNRHTYNSSTETLYIWMFKLTRKVVAQSFLGRKNNVDHKIQTSSAYVNMDNNLHEKDAEIHNIVLDLIYFNNYSLKEASLFLSLDEDEVKVLLRKAINNKSKYVAR